MGKNKADYNRNHYRQSRLWGSSHQLMISAYNSDIFRINTLFMKDFEALTTLNNIITRKIKFLRANITAKIRFLNLTTSFAKPFNLLKNESFMIIKL